MKVLQIAIGYLDSTVYKTLIEHLIINKCHSHVFIPVQSREAKSSGKEVHIINGINLPIRGFYFIKKYFLIKKIIKDIEENHLSFDMIHAHMVFHDGFIAYYLSRRYDIPYVLSVRNTDVQLFIKRAFLRPVMRKILNHSAKIIFINPSYKNIILQKYIQNKNRASIEKKSIVLPNGIMDFWFQNRYLDKANAIGNQITIITVADIDYNKNQISVIKSIEELISRGHNIKYQLVGKIVDKHAYKQIINYPFVEYHSPVPKEELLSYYRKADIFIMTSFYETFGLVYIEALLQGLPIIYSQGHGIDGFFAQGVVGYSVDSRNYLEIIERIIDIINNYTVISNNIKNIDLSLDFSWNEIAKKMVSCYKETLDEKYYK